MSTPRVGSSRISTRGLGFEPAREQHLLLVAAGEAPTFTIALGTRMRQRRDRGPRARRAAREIEHALRGVAARSRHVDVLAHATCRERGPGPCGLRSGRRGPASIASARRARWRAACRRAVTSPPACAVRAEDQAREFGAPGADEARDAEHLALRAGRSCSRFTRRPPSVICADLEDHRPAAAVRRRAPSCRRPRDRARPSS